MIVSVIMNTASTIAGIIWGRACAIPVKSVTIIVMPVCASCGSMPTMVVVSVINKEVATPATVGSASVTFVKSDVSNLPRAIPTASADPVPSMRF